MRLSATLLIPLAACGWSTGGRGPDDSTSAGKPEDSGPPVETEDDVDGDGWRIGEDCDDANPTVYPGAEDPIDGVDEDCDGTVEGGSVPDLALFQLVGAIEYSELATALSFGDTDGDGRVDLAVGASQYDWDGVDESPGWTYGATYVALGGRTGVLDASVSDGVIIGANSGCELGTDVAWLGDLDGNGGAELAVSEPCLAVPDSLARVRVFASPVIGTIRLADAILEVQAAFTGQYVGVAVANPGDVDGDGVDDVLLGMPSEGGYGGAVWVSGAVRGVIAPGDADGNLSHRGQYAAGSAVAGAGDVNGDGTPDLLVGSPGENADGPNGFGDVHLALGPAFGEVDLGDADATISGIEDMGELGDAVASVADVDGDDLPDLVLSASGQWNDTAGVVWVVPGSARGKVHVDEVAWASYEGQTDVTMGRSLATGDFDGDGTPDVLTGGPEMDVSGVDRAGEAYLVRPTWPGAHSIVGQGWRLQGAEDVGRTGWEVAMGGDFDGDGIGDLAVGSTWLSDRRGEAAVISGAAFVQP